MKSYQPLKDCLVVTGSDSMPERLRWADVVLIEAEKDCPHLADEIVVKVFFKGQRVEALRFPTKPLDDLYNFESVVEENFD